MGETKNPHFYDFGIFGPDLVKMLERKIASLFTPIGVLLKPYWSTIWIKARI